MNKKQIEYFIGSLLVVSILIIGFLLYKLDRDVKEMKVEITESYNHINSFYYFLNRIPLGLPLDSIKITSVYGWRHSKKHKGIDLRGTYKDSVYVTADGIVKKSGWMYGYGNCVVVDHLNGYTTLYAHLRKILVKKNDVVCKNQSIGIVGSTGFSTGTHLHYEIKHLGDSKDPYYYIMFDKNN